MKKTYLKLLRRGVRKTMTRFISILAIVAVGTGFLAGLLATTPDMQHTADKYYDDNYLFDLNIKGSYGITDKDIRELEKLDTTDKVMGCYCTDVEMTSGEGSYVARIFGVPLSENGTEGLLNGFVLTEGRLAQDASECVIVCPNEYSRTYSVGDVFTISPENKDYANLSDTYAFNELTVVGIARSPHYMSMEGEPSTVGTGTVSLIMFVLPECYKLEVYTDAFITLTGAAKLNAFTAEYTELIDKTTDDMDSFSKERCAARRQEIVDEATAELNKARDEYNTAVADTNAQLSSAKNEIDSGYAQLADAYAQIEAQREQLEQAEAAIPIAEADLKTRMDQARADALNALNMGVISQAQYDATIASIASQEAAAQGQINTQKQKVQSGWTALASGEAQAAGNSATLSQAQSEYEAGRAEAQEKLADAKIKIDDAQREIDELEEPEWYFFDRSDTVSYTSYKSNSEKVGAIAKVFPIFFFFVAALVALTTMTRMVEEERMQIGTLKALGYSDKAILFYYIGYSTLASLLGSAIGMLLGFKTLPVIIANAYTMMYTMPKTITIFRWDFAVVIALIAIACTTVATLAACLSQLKEKPSTLMLPRAPKAGKRIFLEKINFFWKRLGFTAKVTARNIFRYKKRFYMTVFGIAGCCALLLTGFGLRDSIGDIVNVQFGDIYNYNLSIYLKEDGVYESDELIASYLNTSPHITQYAPVHYESVTAEKNSQSVSANLNVPRNADEMNSMINMRVRSSQEKITFTDDSVVLTEKMCETLGLKIGDSVSIKDSDGKMYELTVTDIMENYVTAYIFISASTYEQVFGETPEYTLVLATLDDESAEVRDEISQDMLKSDNILLLQFSQTIRESFANTVKNIDYIVLVLIFSAIALAVIVLYNLTNINICERSKELATIKVLGFHNKEVASYIYREINILSMIGIAVGFGLGIWLHSFVIKTAEVDAVMFGRVIYLRSYLFAAGVTALTTALVDIVMLKKLKKIDMVESMKANE